MEKSQLNERDICTKFTIPVLNAAGWNEMSEVREESRFTMRRVIVGGKLATRGKGKRVHFVFYYKPNIPFALLEANFAPYAEAAE